MHCFELFDIIYVTYIGSKNYSNCVSVCVGYVIIACWVKTYYMNILYKYYIIKIIQNYVAVKERALSQ